MQGTRRVDDFPGVTPDFTWEMMHPGDYFKQVDKWFAMTPDGVFGCVKTPIWTIEEHEDGTITVAPSIWFNKPTGWHGYLERGVWRRVITVFFACMLLLPLSSLLSQDTLVAFVKMAGDEKGMTLCTTSNKPLILLDARLHADSLAQKEIVAHEMDHVRRAIVYPGGCVVFMRRYREDTEFRFDVELHGYCQNLLLGVKQKIIKQEVAPLYVTLYVMQLHQTAQSFGDVLLKAQDCIKRGNP